MPQDEPIEEVTPGYEQEVGTAPPGADSVERLVLNGTSGGEEELEMQQFATALLEVVAGARNLNRPEVAELLGTAMDRIDRQPQSAELDALTDKVLRGSRLGLTVLTDDGKVLGHVEGENGNHRH